MEKVSVPSRFKFFKITKRFGVSHASLVLKDPILKHGKPLEKSNPQFREMMEAVAAFSDNDEVVVKTSVANQAFQRFLRGLKGIVSFFGGKK
ncbi:MAG: hypothetical protein D3923_14405 [Candidatus Electrothrix sp. AR3]|nr:hypothetical protein [Candidatus Electrothrix sp. AR3]